MKKIASIILLLVVGLASNAFANPQGATVVSGDASFNTETPNTLTVTTASNKTIINYDSFSIAANEATIFNQPNASSAVLNRVVGIDPSLLYGSLSSNGKLFLVNPNGILFGPGSHVNAPAIVASTLDISNDDFLNENFRFNNGNGNANIVNQGSLAAKPGGYIALLSQSVNNQGIILADSGTVVLAAGNKMTLGLDSLNQISVVVDDAVKSQVVGPDGLPVKDAISNSGVIEANGGKVILTAKVLNDIFDHAVNNTGVVQAVALSDQDGVIELTSNGDIQSTGSLEATSVTERGNSFEVGGIFYVAEADILNADKALTYTANTKVFGKISDAADIIINPFVTLTMKAKTSFIAGGAFIMDPSSTLTGGGYNLSISAESPSTLGNINNVKLLTLSSGSDVTFTSNSSSTFQVNTLKTNFKSLFSRSFGSGTSSDPIMIYSVSNAPGGLQYIQTSGNLGASYKMANNIDASETSNWNGGQGFLPIGTPDLVFTGNFDGNTKTISNLYINRPLTDYIGLFGYVDRWGTNISQLGLVNSDVTGRNYVGGLIGSINYFSNSSADVNFTDVNNVYVTGEISGNEQVGGLVGVKSYATLNNSYNAATVSGNNIIGGLVGYNKGHITYSYNTGRVLGGNEVGGLVGENNVGSIGHSYNTGIVSGANYVGGLAGKSFDYYQNASISDSYNTGAVSGSDAVGGLVGFGGYWNLISLSHNEGKVTGYNDVGGLIGINGGQSRVVSSYNSGKVVGSGNYVGGVAGSNHQGSIEGSFNLGTVYGTDYVGGITGMNEGHNYGGRIYTSHNQGTIKGRNYVGGVVGANTEFGFVGGSYNLAPVSGSGDYVGGVAGINGGFSGIGGSYNTGNVLGKSHVGGLVGEGNTYGSSITNSFYDIDTVLINKSHAITLGALYDNQFTDWIGHGFTLDPTNYFSQDASGRYLINTLTDLKNILGFTNWRPYKFLVTNNIDLASVPGFYIPWFMGDFDGNGRTISNLKVNVSNDYVGLFGINSGSIRNLGVVNANVTGLNVVGVLAGANGGTISNAYVTGTVKGANSVGGLAGKIGYHTDGGSIINSYVGAGSVTGDSNTGGLVGNPGYLILNSFYNIDTVSINKAHAVSPGGLYDAQFKDWIAQGFSLNVADYFSQDSSGYFLINNMTDLKNILGFSTDSGYKFLLNSNIDLKSLPGFYIPVFSGEEFNGNGKTISNLKVNLNTDNLGLFGRNSGLIRNLGLVNAKITGGNLVGGLAGWNSGTIMNSYHTGKVSGRGFVGGLVGYNSYGGSIVNAYHSGNVSGYDLVGGLVGRNDGAIANAFNTGKVSGNNYVGGLVGYNNGGIINSAWWTGASGNAIGYNYATGGAVARLSLQGFGTDEAVKSSFFSKSKPVYSTWDFTKIWKTSKKSYPVLR